MEREPENREMERSGGDSVFESLNLSPQLFVNEVRNAVDDLLDEAFTFFIKEASVQLKIENTERSAELTKGADYIRDLVSLTVEQRMQKWEEYCFHFCFRVPDGFSLPKANEPSRDDLPGLDALTNKELDEELTSLREKLAEIGREIADLSKELHPTKRQLSPNDQSTGSIDEELLQYEKQGANEMFQELTAVASEFRSKLENLKRTRMEEIQHDRTKRLYLRSGDILGIPVDDGAPGVKLQEMEQFLREIQPL